MDRTDEYKYWAEIEEAASFIGRYCTKWGRLGGQAKEKYGTVRFYPHFGYLSLSTLIYPGYFYSPMPKWLFKLDIRFINPVLDLFLGRPFVDWQAYIYHRAYKKALVKWPHLRAEILCSASHLELLHSLVRIRKDRIEVVGWDGEIISVNVRHGL